MVDNPRSFGAGLGQGIVAPLFELIGSIMISASLKAAESVEGTSGYITSMIVIVTLADFARNILLGFSRTQFALGNLVGNIIGLILFFGAISSISQDAAAESLLLAIALIVSYALGLYIYWKRGE